MRFFLAIRSELTKTKHTSIRALHVVMPIIGSVLFIIYFILYQNTDIGIKLKLIMECIALVFPLLISVVVGVNILQEIKASHLQNLLAVPNRSIVLLAKLTVLYAAGIIALAMLFFLFIMGIDLVGLLENIKISMLVRLFLGMAYCNFVIYMIHIFITLKFGVGSSLLLGIFESLHCILYSNIELRGIWRYTPFAWTVDWIHDVIKQTLSIHGGEWIWVGIISIGLLLLLLRWFYFWEV